MRYTFRMNPIHTIADNIGAFAAAATSVVGVPLVAAGQVPVPSGIPAEWVAVLVGVGPALAWFLTRVLAASAAYYSTIKSTSRSRADTMEAAREKDPDSGAVIRSLRDAADRAEAKEAALKAFHLPRTGS